MIQDTMHDYQGKRVLVTGAGAGIGRTVAVRLGQAGASVTCPDLDGESAKQAAEEVGERGVALVGDAAHEADVERVVGPSGRVIL